MTADLITAAGAILGLSALLVFALQRPFMARVWAFAVMTLSGLLAVGAQSVFKSGGLAAFAVLAVPGIVISAALMLLAFWLTRELRRLSGETDPDGGEGHHD